jgi:hypothetical protein
MPIVITPSGNKFVAKLGLDDVEIGDILSSTFKPHVKIKRFANQCDLAISYPTASTGLATLDAQNNKVGFIIDANTRVEIYSKDSDADLVAGSMEFDVILTKKPAGNKNTISLKLDSTTIDWTKILPLNVEYDQTKCIDRFPKHIPPFVITPTSISDATGEVLLTRAENKINSYEGKAKQVHKVTSVLGKNKNNGLDMIWTDVSETHAHIRRGKARDSVGTEVWVEDMNLLPDGTFIFTLPLDFIKNAVYPIRQAVGVDPAYTQTWTSWQSDGYGGADGVWHDYDIFTALSVPKGAVVSVVLSNSTTGTENRLGIRTDGSALNRRVTLHEAEGGGQTHCRMFATVHATTGLIECYHSDVSDADYFYLSGYWQNVTFTERFTPFQPSSYADWVNSTLGAGCESKVTHIIMENWGVQDVAKIGGVRANGSALERKILIHESESGGSTALDLLVKADASGIIEVYGDDSSNSHFDDMGYFGTEMDFVELWQEIPLTTTSWEAEDLTAYLDADGRMVDFLLVHLTESTAGITLGVRDGDDAATERKLVEHEAESAGAGGEYTGFSMSAKTNASGVVNLISNGAGEMFMLTGYFKPATIIGGWANIKNIRAGTGTILATDLASIWFGTTEVAVADIAELCGVLV